VPQERILRKGWVPVPQLMRPEEERVDSHSLEENVVTLGRTSRRILGALASTSILSLVLASAGVSAGEQQTLDPRQAMVTALSASGPHPSLGDDAQLFDRFVGTWDCEYANYAADGSVSRSTGEVLFGWIIDGRAMQDIWLSYPEDADSERHIGTSVRYYDTKLAQWRVVWVDPVSGSISIVTGGAVGERIVLGNQDTDGTMRRWSFNDIRPNSFIWRSEKSRDGGKTWRLEAEYHMKRRGVASPTSSQSRDGAIADSRRAMITVLPASQPHPSIAGKAQLFDRFVGTWDCDYTFFLGDGSARQSSGELRFGWIIDGRALQDIWVTYPKEGSEERAIGTSVRFFDTKSNMWRVVFVSPAFGAVISVQGEAEGDRIVLRGVDDQGGMLRWSFDDIQADSFIWHGETSRDGGKSWKLEEEHHMRRRSSARP